MWWTGQTSERYILPHLPNAISPPAEYALYKYKFRNREYILAPRGRTPFGAEGREWANYRKQEILSKVIAGIAQRDGNVPFLFHYHKIQMLEMRIAYLQ